ncbi:MAG: hypothetical protein J2P17_11700 [Mycobacterium sp.]|nr:hypothetical protein [Mycobacterium sp.]
MSKSTQDEQAVKDMLEQIAAESEATMNDPMPAGTVYTRPNRAKSVSVTFSLRLKPDELAAVQQIADERGVPASTVVRGWIARQLEAERNAPTDTAAVVERLEADVRTLRALIAS